jgi:hypothetical protein
MLVTLVVAGWLILCGFGALRAVVVLGNAASTAYFGVHDPRSRLAAEVPELLTAGEHERLARKQQLRTLEIQLAGPLLGVALLGGWGALRLLRRRPWSRALLLGVGLAAIGISAYHTVLSVQLTTAEAGLVAEGRGRLSAFYAVAGINVGLQSLPLVLVMSLLRHPILRRYVSEPPGGEATA